MHLVLGLLLAVLSARRKGAGSKSPLLSLSHPIRTLHLLPGRVRFHIPAIVGDPAAVERVRSTMVKLDGIGQVEASPVSGSVLLTYDPEKISPELLLTALVRLLGLESEMRQAPLPLIARELDRLTQALNRALYEQSSGLLDLNTALPLLRAASS